MLETDRLILRSWENSDAEDLYKYASNPDVGPIAGWPPHQSIDESRDVIKNVLNGREAYAICLKTDNKAIGAIELKLNGHTDMTERDDECELGYWLGKPFWGQGLMPEAAQEILRHAFEDIGMQKVWCGYYEGNTKSKRVQEKIGFKYQWTTEGVDVPLMHEKRTGHVNLMTKEDWLGIPPIKRGELSMRTIKPMEEKYQLPALDMVEQVFSEWDSPEEGQMVRRLMEEIRAKKYYMPQLELVMTDEDDGIIGYCMFSRFHIEGRYEDELLILTPVAVRTDMQRKGISRELIEYGFEQARSLGFKAVLVEGNPKNYNPRGFVTSADHGIIAGPDIHLPHVSCLMIKELEPGALEHIHGTVDYSFYDALREE